MLSQQKKAVLPKDLKNFGKKVTFLNILITGNLIQEIKNLESSIIKSEKYFKTEISKTVSKSQLESVKMKVFPKKNVQQDKKGY